MNKYSEFNLNHDNLIMDHGSYSGHYITGEVSVVTGNLFQANY